MMPGGIISMLSASGENVAGGWELWGLEKQP